MLYYTGWGMSSSCPHPDEAYQLIHFLCGREGQVEQSRAGLSLPSRMSVAYSDDFLNPPPPTDPDDSPIPKHDAKIFLDAVDVSRIQQIPEQTEWRDVLETDLSRCVQTGQETPRQMAADVQRDWIAELDSPIHKGNYGPMPWAGHRRRHNRGAGGDRRGFVVPGAEAREAWPAGSVAQELAHRGSSRLSCPGSSASSRSLSAR